MWNSQKILWGEKRTYYGMVTKRGKKNASSKIYKLFCVELHVIRVYVRPILKNLIGGGWRGTTKP